MSADEATRPNSFCWGYRAPLCEGDADLANAALPLHVLPNPGGYGLESVSPRQRNKIRNGLKNVRIVEILTPELLFEQGYEIYNSARGRNGYGDYLTPDRYRRVVGDHFLSRGIVLGGVVEGRLAGYLTAFAVDGTAYIKELWLHTDALHSQIGSAILFTLIGICGRSESIHEIVHSPHMPENEGLSRHKMEMGFSVVHIPARTWFAPGLREVVIEGYLRRNRPHAYYRLFGRY